MSEIETGRLRLRRLSVADAPFILELLNDPSFLRFIGDKGVRTLDDARKYIGTQIASYERFGFGLYLTERKDDGAPIGICGLVKRDSLDDVDVGFAFAPAFWSQGYAAESAAAVIAHATGILKLPRVVAITNPDNTASMNLLNKIGLRFSRMTRLTADGPEVRLFSTDAQAPR
ncbi:MAG TPA: GNAT family N-acetyltransferase [Vicinamibacterales bacterium]